MSASTEPPGDAELARLLDAYRDAVYDLACDGPEYPTIETRAALLVHIAATYVRRDANRLPPSPPGSYRAARGVVPWRPGDAERLHTLHYDDAGQVVSGAPDFEGDGG